MLPEPECWTRPLGNGPPRYCPRSKLILGFCRRWRIQLRTAVLSNEVPTQRYKQPERPSVLAISSPKPYRQASPMPATWRSSWAPPRSSWGYPTILFLALSATLSPICGFDSTPFTPVARACNGSATSWPLERVWLRLRQARCRHPLALVTFSFFLF